MHKNLGSVRANSYFRYRCGQNPAFGRRPRGIWVRECCTSDVKIRHQLLTRDFFEFQTKALLDCVIFSVGFFLIFENVALLRSCVHYNPISAACNIFDRVRLALRSTLFMRKRNCRKIARKVAERVIHCAVVFSVDTIRFESRAKFYSLQRFAQQQKREDNHVTLCNSPATCLVTALRDKLLRKLRSVTGP